MQSHIGVDWASGRWVVAELRGDQISIDTEPSFLNVWDSHQEASAILVDIPIGLPEDGPRACDAAARKELGSRGSSVFSVPSRGAVEAGDYGAAVEANEEANCGGLGSQSWGIVPRIREVDVFLQRNETARGRVYESHPEICFAGFAKDVDLQSKLDSEGLAAREQIISKIDGSVGEEVSNFLGHRRDGNAKWHYRIHSGRLDDVLDAVVLALSGREIGLRPGMEGSEYSSLPQGKAERDGKGLKMEIVTPAI